MRCLSKVRAIRGAPTSTCGSAQCRSARTFSFAIHGISAKTKDPFVPWESFPTLKVGVPAPFDPKLQLIFN